MSLEMEYAAGWSDEKFLSEAKRLSEEWEETAACYSYDAMLTHVGERRGIYVPYLWQVAFRIKEAGKCDGRLERCCCRRHLGGSEEARQIQEEMKRLVEQVYQDGINRGYRIAKGLPVVGDEFTEAVNAEADA